MIEVIAFLGGSDAAKDPAWEIYFLILFLFAAVPIAIILGLIFLLLRSFLKKSIKSKVKNSSDPNFTPYIFAITGAVFLLANIGGSKYSDKPKVLDSILLALPFTFGGLASLHKFLKYKRKIFLVLTFVSAILFLYYHYPRWF